MAKRCRRNQLIFIPRPLPVWYLAQSMTMNYNLILASGSPRRQQLLHDLGVPFTVQLFPVEETYPPELAPERVATYLSEKKGQAYQAHIASNELVITADTTVLVGDEVLNKPADAAEARGMLIKLSGTVHRVVTGVSLTRTHTVDTFSDTTYVYFRALSENEIDYYVRHFQPFDKAGGYAIQEWIGMVGIEKIEGSYFNVVGLPVEKLYGKLKNLADIAPR